MTQQNKESKRAEIPNWSAIHHAQIEQAQRSERMEKKQDKTDEKIDKLVSSISGLTATLTQYSSELRHARIDVNKLEKAVDKVRDDVETLKIDGNSRETRLKLIIGIMSALFSAALAWLIGGR